MGQASAILNTYTLLWHEVGKCDHIWYHPTASCDRFNLNTSDSEIMISEQSDWSVILFKRKYNIMDITRMRGPLDGTFNKTVN